MLPCTVLRHYILEQLAEPITAALGHVFRDWDARYRVLVAADKKLHFFERVKASGLAGGKNHFVHSVDNGSAAVDSGDERLCARYYRVDGHVALQAAQSGGALQFIAPTTPVRPDNQRADIYLKKNRAKFFPGFANASMKINANKEAFYDHLDTAFRAPLNRVAIIASMKMDEMRGACLRQMMEQCASLFPVSVTDLTSLADRVTMARLQAVAKAFALERQGACVGDALETGVEALRQSASKGVVLTLARTIHSEAMQAQAMQARKSEAMQAQAMQARKSEPVQEPKSEDPAVQSLLQGPSAMGIASALRESRHVQTLIAKDPTAFMVLAYLWRLWFEVPVVEQCVVLWPLLFPGTSSPTKTQYPTTNVQKRPNKKRKADEMAEAPPSSAKKRRKSGHAQSDGTPDGLGLGWIDSLASDSALVHGFLGSNAPTVVKEVPARGLCGLRMLIHILQHS